MESARPRYLLARALLTSTAFVLLVLPLTILVGGFLPGVPRVNELGGVLTEALPWLWPPILGAVILSGLAVGLGGRRGAGLLLILSLLATSMAGIVTWSYASFAAAHGASYEVLPALQASRPTRGSDTQVAFATVADATLHANVWRPTARTGTAHPAVVYVHGGGFVGGSLDRSPRLFASLADGGIEVIDVEYRLSPPPRWDQAPGDVLCALAWLRTVADDEGIDPNHVVVMGESAGGSLALLAAYAAGTDLLASSCAGEPIVPAGVIAVAPAADLAGIWSDATMVAEGRPFPEAYVGGSPSEYPDRYALASPFRLIRPGLPPTLLLAAGNDRWVHPARVAAIADLLIAAGVDCRYLVVPFADHGFDGREDSFGAQLEAGIVPAFVREVAR